MCIFNTSPLGWAAGVPFQNPSKKGVASVDTGPTKAQVEANKVAAAKSRAQGYVPSSKREPMSTIRRRRRAASANLRTGNSALNIL